MKKRLSILLIFSMLMVMMSAFAACSEKEETTKKKKTKKTKESVETVETETDPPTDTEPTDSSEDLPTEPESTPTDTTVETESSEMTFGKDQSQSSNPEVGTLVEIGPHEFPGYEYHQVTIEEQEIVNQDGLVIKIFGYKLGGGNARSFELNVDNQTGHPVKITSDLLKINGFEVSGFFISEFEDQTNTDADYDFFMSLGTDIGDWDPRTAEFRFEVEYTDTEATYKTELSSIVTSAYDESATYDFSYGATIFDDGTMLVQAIDFKLDGRGGAEMLLYIENNRDTKMIFDKEIFRINGLDASVMVYKYLEPHSKTILSALIYKSDLEEIGISDKDIHSITLQLLIREEGNYQDKIYGDLVTVKLK